MRKKATPFPTPCFVEAGYPVLVFLNWHHCAWAGKSQSGHPGNLLSHHPTPTTTWVGAVYFFFTKCVLVKSELSADLCPIQANIDWTVISCTWPKNGTGWTSILATWFWRPDGDIVSISNNVPVRASLKNQKILILLLLWKKQMQGSFF